MAAELAPHARSRAREARSREPAASRVSTLLEQVELAHIRRVLEQSPTLEDAADEASFDG
jgi:hypothetical protein